MASKILGILRLHGFARVRIAGRGSCWLEGGEGMTPAEKADSLKKLSNELGNLYDEDYELLLEAAAHFRTLIPDANGLLPCPMCGAGTPIKVLEQRYKGMAWRRIQCRGCALYTPMRRTEIEARRLWNRRGGVAHE